MRRLMGLLAGVLLVCCGCQVTARVSVDANPDGSGRVQALVTLDADAVRQAGDLRSELVTADLVRAGWRIDGPTTLPNGGAEVQATKSFRTAAGMRDAIVELTG